MDPIYQNQLEMFSDCEPVRVVLETPFVGELTQKRFRVFCQLCIVYVCVFMDRLVSEQHTVTTFYSYGVHIKLEAVIEGGVGKGPLGPQFSWTKLDQK